VLHTNRLQQAQALIKWICKHAGLMRSLQLQLPSISFVSGSGQWAAGIATALGNALQHAAASAPLQLQYFALKDAASGLCLLQQLPAGLLTELRAQVDFSSSSSLQAIGALTSLRHLELTNTEAANSASPV
jgi:hypothetical protein